MSASKRILVVEDEFMIGLYIQDTLAELGYQVFTAVTAIDAEAILAGNELDLAILDYRLQGGTSIRLAEHLNFLGIPFIVCSGSTGLEELDEAFRRKTFLRKPFSTDQLLEAVTSAGKADEVEE